jgi:hypothetical protein
MHATIQLSILSSQFLCKNVKIKINTTIILPVILYGSENLVYHHKGRTKTKGIWEQNSEEDILT